MREQVVSQETRERRMYGSTESEAVAGLRKLARFHTHRPKDADRGMRMALGSILSDVQEMILRGLDEEARQALNVVKLGLFDYDKVKSGVRPLLEDEEA